MRCSTPFPRPIDQYPTVRTAVQIWAAGQVFSAFVFGVLLLWFVLNALLGGITPVAPPPPLRAEGSAQPRLITQENWKYQTPTKDDLPHVWYRKGTPPQSAGSMPVVRAGSLIFVALGSATLWNVAVLEARFHSGQRFGLIDGKRIVLADRGES